MAAYSGMSKKSKVKAIDVDLEDESDGSDGSELSIDDAESLFLLDKEVFRPDQSKLLDLEKKGASAIAKQKEKDLHSTVNLVHAIELLTPGIASAMSFGGTPEQQVERFVGWSSSIKEKATLWANALPIEPEQLPWVIASLERLLAQNPFLNNLPSIDFLIPIAVECELPPENVWVPDALTSPLALLEALGPIAQAQVIHSLYRSEPEKDLMYMAQVLVKTAQEAVLELVDPSFSVDSRQVVFTTVLKQFGKVLRTLWDSYSEEINRKIGRSEQDLERWKASHPNGASLTPLEDSFYDLSSKLVRLSRMAKYK